VGYTLDSNYLDRATLWGGTLPVDLNSPIDPTSGWILRMATGITDDGTIVGIGTYQDMQEAFLLTPISGGSSSVPEPGTLSLLALTALPLLCRRRL
jgi:hypothetical protein